MQVVLPIHIVFIPFLSSLLPADANVLHEITGSLAPVSIFDEFAG
jgi:hypothetical protein